MMLIKTAMLAGCVFLFSSRINVYAGLREIAFPEVEGMSVEYNYPDYTGEDLWDYINGAADGYLAYHFVKLKIAEYKDGSGHIVKVEVYRQQRPEDAYGIYSMERSPDYHFIKIGAEGYSESGLVNFVTGPYYVKVMAEAGGEVSGQELLKVARAVCHALNPEPALPPVLALFPPEGKRPHSESFISTNVLGNEFLKDAFKADYQAGGHSFSIIIFKRDRAEDCIKILKAYFDYTGDPKPAEWKNGPYVVHDKYNGTLDLYLQGNILFGFMDLDDRALIGKLTEEILNNLK